MFQGCSKTIGKKSAIADCGFYEFKRQLEYKSQWYGATVVKIDRFYPSSQLCSCCNHRSYMPLKTRVFNCANCGTTLDRDLNASINIERWHENIDYPKTASSAGFACGGSKKPSSLSTGDSLKQELDIKFIPKQLSLFDE